MLAKIIKMKQKNKLFVFFIHKTNSYKPIGGIKL